MNNSIFYGHFALGLYLGLVFAALALYRIIRLKFELGNYKRHLSNKLEIEAEHLQKIKSEQESLRKENENLRIKVSALNENPDKRAKRDLEVFARAEKRMLVSVPGFAPAWEGAKSAALSELQDEEAGKAPPKSVFSKIFGGSVESTAPAKSLTDSPQAQS
jgi:cell division protein FtsB